MEQQQNGKQLVNYLLGEISPEEQSKLDEQLFVDDDYFERLRVAEDELIDNYARGQLAGKERELFERNFLTNAYVRRRVDLAKSLLDYIDDTARSASRPFVISKPDPGIIELEHSVAPSQFLVSGLQRYKTYLLIAAILRVTLLLLLFWAIIERAIFSDLKAVIISTVLLPPYVVLEMINLRNSVEAAERAVVET